jgi:hypothetical protein
VSDEVDPPAPQGDCQRRIIIPSELHSFAGNGPFRTCSACCQPLDRAGCYEIQKVYRQKEVIFEMALCEGCARGLCQEFSEESLQALKGFLLASYRPSPETFHCHFCGFPRPLVSGYTICGACSGSHLICPALLMCESCTEKLQARISKKTKEVQEDFVRNTFPGVPADLDLSPTFGVL